MPPSKSIRGRGRARRRARISSAPAALQPDTPAERKPSEEGWTTLIVDPEPSLTARAEEGLQTFQQSVQGLLDRLCTATGLDAWMLTRVIGDEWIVVQTAGQDVPIERGGRFPWRGPARDKQVQVLLVPAGAGRRRRLAARHAAALRWRGGQLFGTLCALHRLRAYVDLVAHREPLFEFARSLATMVEREFEIARESRLASYSLIKRWVDCRTRVTTEAQWHQILAIEEQTRDVLLSPASVLAVPAAPGSPGAARALRQALGADVLLTSVGGAHLLALLPDCCSTEADRLRHRACAYLAEAGESTRCTTATVLWGQSLEEAARMALAQQGQRGQK